MAAAASPTTYLDAASSHTINGTACGASAPPAPPPPAAISAAAAAACGCGWCGCFCFCCRMLAAVLLAATSPVLVLVPLPPQQRCCYNSSSDGGGASTGLSMYDRYDRYDCCRRGTSAAATYCDDYFPLRHQQPALSTTTALLPLLPLLCNLLCVIADTQPGWQPANQQLTAAFCVPSSPPLLPSSPILRLSHSLSVLSEQ